MFDLFTVGELMWLTTLEVAQFPKPGKTTAVRKVQHMIGNDAVIVAIMASRMGLGVKLCSNPVSRYDGQKLINILQKNKVSHSWADSSANPTPTNYCLLEKNGNRTWLPPHIDFFPTLPKSPITTKYVYIDFYEEAMRTRLETLSELVIQKKRIFLNLSASSIDDKLKILAKNYKKKISVLQFSSSQNTRQAQKTAENILKNLSLEAVLITLGENGSVLCAKDGISIRVGDRNKKILRNMGAGATFSAGFIYGLTKGYTYKDAHNIAARKSIEFCTTKHNPLQ